MRIKSTIIFDENIFFADLMVLILDGNLEIGTYALREIGHLICVRHLFRSTAVTIKNWNKKNFFLYSLHLHNAFLVTLQ